MTSLVLNNWALKFSFNISGSVGCWATSFGQCMKVQEIDLIDRGCSPKILDNVRPDICVSEW